jgi:hypothetical protein
MQDLENGCWRMVLLRLRVFFAISKNSAVNLQFYEKSGVYLKISLNIKVDLDAR